MMKKIIALLLILIMTLALCACEDGNISINNPGNKNPGATYSPEADPNAQKTHTITITDDQGNKLQGIYVTISLGEDESYRGGMTDENGVCIVEMPQQDGYKITLMAIPDECEAEESYTFTGLEANIVLKTIAE